MLGSDDLTTRILIEIRDRLDQTNARLDKVNDNLGVRIDGLARTLDLKVEGVDSKIERVHQQLVESDMREGMRHVDFVASMRGLYDMLQTNFALRDRVERCELDIAELRARHG